MVALRATSSLPASSQQLYFLSLNPTRRTEQTLAGCIVALSQLFRSLVMAQVVLPAAGAPNPRFAWSGSDGGRRLPERVCLPPVRRPALGFS